MLSAVREWIEEEEQACSRKYCWAGNPETHTWIAIETAVGNDFLETPNLTPYKLFYPEKRQFFLENAGIFDFSTGFNDLLFFSRQIGIDPNTGQDRCWR